jgi:hypothetical protein
MPTFIIGMMLFVAVACLGWIKLRYGFNFTDEGYLATESWRLEAGDHFLDDKITGALMHYTLINSFIFKIYPDISLLQMRHLQFILNIAALLIFGIALFRQTDQYCWLPFVFSLFAFTGLDPVGLISNLYYQTYPHLFLIFYLSFLLFGFQTGKPAIKKIFFVLSGFCLWFMTLSLLYLGTIIFAPIFLWGFSKKLKLKDFNFTFSDLLSVTTPFILSWMLFIVIYQKEYLLNVVNSVDVIISMSQYSKGLITLNWEQIRRILFSMVMLSLFLGSIKKIPVYFSIAICTFLSIFILLTINTPFLNFFIPYYNGWFGRPMWFSSLLMAFTILFWIYTLIKYIYQNTFSNNEQLVIILMFPFSICALTMNICSGLGSMAVCQTAIPAVAAIYLFFESKISHPKFRQIISIIIISLLLGPFYYTTARHDWEFTFYDVRPEYANVRIDKGFGGDIYTNQLYLKLYNWLIANANYFTHPDDYAISYLVSPMVHMITGLRPSLDDTFIYFGKPKSYFDKCIQKMIQRRREPKIAFIFERWPMIEGGSEIFRPKEFDFLTSDDPISIYIKTHMTPASTFKISDDNIIRCYVDFNLAKDREISKNTP